MNNRVVWRARQVVLGGAAAVLVGLGLGGCSSSGPVAAPESPSPVTPVGNAPTSTTTAAAPAKATTAPPRRFAGTVVSAQLVGYDAARKMVEFRTVIRYPSEVKQDDYDFDPKDQAVHRLPLAQRATVDGIGGGGSRICSTDPPMDETEHCTTQQLIDVLKNRPATPLVVQLVVDSSDTITRVAEQIGTLFVPAGN